MPDLRQALRDFVTTSNSGKYSDEATLLSKFPELQGYSVDVLRDFVTTSNSGKYATEDELLSKFPEFGIGATEVKKKEAVLPPRPNPNATDLPLGIGSLEYAKPSKPAAVKAPVDGAVTEKVSVGPMGMVGLERTKEYVPAKEEGKQGVILNTVSSLDKGFYKNLIGSPVKGLGTALEGVTGKGFVSDALIKFGDYFNKTIDELTPQDEEFKNTLTDQFGQAFGQVVSLVVTSGIGSALGKGATAAGTAEAAIAAQTAPTAAGTVSALKTLGSELASPTAVSAGLSMGQGEFERAKEAGATDEQAFEAFYKNAAVGSILEKIPVMQFLKRFEKASAGGITNYLKTKGVAGITGGIEEMTTEVLQGIYANLTAQDIYDANQQMFDGIGEAGGVGFGVGFLLNAMGANVKILRSQGREDEAQVVENQIAEFESQAAKGGKSSYKMGGVKIESADIISDMIDNMTAADLTKANIEIENDPELNKKLQDKIITSSVKEQVRQGNPDLNEASLDAITKLELELRSLEGNTTQTGKDKAAAIRSQIKNIQENQLTEEVDNSARIAELEGILSSADRNLAETGFTSLSQDARVEIEKELQDLKTKQDAVQKQATVGVPVQPTPGDSGKMEEGEPQAKPQGVAEEGVTPEVVKEEVTPELTEQEQDAEISRLNDKVFEAKKNIARAEDTEAAIEEYNAAKKELEDFEASVQQKKDVKKSKSNVESLIEDENTASKRGGYEYKELYDQDPRLAALQNAKDLLEFVKSEDIEQRSTQIGETIEEAKKSQERSLLTIQKDIADLQADLEANPLVSSKTQEEVAPVVEEEKVSITKDELPDYQKSTQTEITKKILDYFAEVVGIPKFTEDVSKKTYVSWLRNTWLDGTNTLGRTVADKLNYPKKAFNVIDNYKKELAKKAAPATEAVLEVEQYEPITEQQVSHEKKFNKNTAIDYEEDTRETDSGREVTYLSRVTVEALDDNTGDAIGGLTKIVDEDKNVSWQALDVDGNELGKEDFGSLEEAKAALVKNWNKTQKKEFDKQAKIKAKAAEKEAAKKEKATEKAAAKKAKVAPKTEEGPTAEDLSEIDALLDLDIENEDNMQIVLNALDNADKAITRRLRSGANDALLAIPLSTVQIVIKAVRTLVKGGMLLRDAIRKVAADNNLSENNVIDVLNSRSLDITNKGKSNIPMSADNVLYDDSDVLPKPEKKVKNSSVAKKLQEVAAKFWGGSIVTSSNITEEQEDAITENGINEAIQAFESSGKNAADWYSKAIETAIAVAGVIHPELSSKEVALKIEAFAKEKDPVRAAQMALRMALAITSQNLNVDANTIYAEEQFEYFKKNGKFDPSKEYGAKAPAISSNLRLANLLIETLGLNEAENFISKEFTVKDLEDAFKKVTDKQLSISGLRNDVVNGAAIFGPKIGQGFLQNLMGKFDPVTIDLWMRRTWGRWTGDVVGTGITDERMARLFLSVKEAIKNKELKIDLPKEFTEYKPVQEKNKSGKLFWTMNQKFSDRVENDIDFAQSINKVAKEISLKANSLYKVIHDMPMTKELYDKFISGELSYVQVANKLSAIREAMGVKYSEYASKERLNKRKPISKQEWIDSEDKKLKRTFSPSNEEISKRKPKWGNEAKNIVDDLNPIDVPTNLDRRVITRVVNNIKKGMNDRGYNVTNADVQALLWYPEKDIWAKLRGEKESNLKLSYDDQFIQLAEKRGLGKQAEEVASSIRGRGPESDIPTPQRGGNEVVPTRIDEVLDLDVTNKDNLDKVFGFIDNADKAITKRLRGSANDALLAIPLSTIQLVVKSLKVLVKGGMMLRDAIRKVATDNNVSQQIVKDILNVSEIQEGFDALMVKVDEMIARQTRRGTPEARMVSNIDTLVRNSEVYQNANDAQKKILEREARARAGVSARRAPSIGRILGVLKDITNVSRQDKLAIISKIRQLSKDAAKDLAAEIKELAKGGKITANQAANIVAKFGKVNMLSEISVSKFVDYMTKIFNDAEYASKLSKAKNTKKELSSLSKNKDKNANLRDLAQQFVKIDPSMVEDIDAYNEMASKIKESIKGSTIRGQKVSFAETVNIENATEYINKTLDAQLELMKEEKAAEIQSLMGIDVSDFSYEDMMMLLESDKPITKYNEGIIRGTINKAFSVFSSIIRESINTGKDPFTGEDVKFTESQKDVVERFMAMDLNILKPKEALQAVDALANFLQNQSTAKMEAVVSKYTGIANAVEVNEKGIVASPLKKYWSKTIGRILGEQTTNLNVLFERMFKGFNKGGFVMDKMGLTKLINKKSFAEKQANNIVDKYVEKFYKLKANGEAFNSAYNNIERGMAAFMMRNVIGTEQEMKAEFDRRKNLMEESIYALSNGNDKERAKAKLYQQAYDNIVKDSENIDDIKKNTDKVNLDGINFWMNEWENKFEQLSDVSENVYNKTLDKDINYTPDRFYKLSSDTGTVEIGDDDSAFIANSGLSNLYQRATGVLMTAVRPESLPVNPESGDVNRYIDLSFDNNNSNSMYDALVDINTAAPIRQIQAFLNSSEFKKIVPTSEDAKILKDRIQLYVRNIRDKNPYSNDELSSVVRKLNKIAAIGVGQALGGITQPIKQVIPVAINTLINGGGLDLSATFNQAKNAFINNSGYAIASRGLESQAQVESLNKLIEEVSETKGEKLMAGVEKLNKWWLDKFLVKPDVFIARASWLTYYEQSLQKQGIDTKDLDYSTHKINEDAANYAQRMVDRQQNVSDTDLAGKLFASRESANQLLVKTLMPFASFRMNQSARLGADLATLTNKTSTKEDKKVALRSAAGFAAEVATFRMVSIGISVLLGSLAKAIMGKEEDDEEYEKRVDNIIKGARTGTFTDIFSPVPIADKLVQAGGALITQSIEDATELPIAIYSPRKEEFLQNAGLFGITADRAAQLWEISKLAATGEYTDDFGKEKTISSDDQEGLSFLIPAAILTNIGLAPSEVNSVVRYAIKDAKKKRKSLQEKEDKAERVEDRRETKEQKLDAFDNLKKETSDPAILNAIDEKIKELRATSEQKKEIERKNKAERELKKSLLVDPETGEEYDTETEMKRYNQDLWEKNFGEESKWYKSHEAEKEATKLLNKEIRRMEDEEYNYVTPTRKPKRARNSDGTFKRKRREL